MAELNFDATLYKPNTGDEPTYSPAIPSYSLRPQTQQAYNEACQQRKAQQAVYHTAWKDAVAELNTIKAKVALCRAEYNECNKLPTPRPPYIDILTSGGTVDPELIYD